MLWAVLVSRSLSLPSWPPLHSNCFVFFNSVNLDCHVAPCWSPDMLFLPHLTHYSIAICPLKHTQTSPPPGSPLGTPLEWSAHPDHTISVLVLTSIFALSPLYFLPDCIVTS